MHFHWKKHETVKVICKPCKPGQIQEYANEIARLSGGIPVNIIGDDTIVFYRGKNYVQPEVMSPVDTLSKKKVIRMAFWFNFVSIEIMNLVWGCCTPS
jgi:RNA-binding protein YhbY